MTRPAVFLIHGMWATPATFAGLRLELETAGHATYAPALPFHDRSPDAPPPPELGRLGIADYVDFLVAEVAKLPEVPVIAGHSMGGLLAQLVAARVQPPGLMLFAPAATATTNIPAWGPVRTMARVTTRGSWWKSPTKIDADHARWGIFNEVPPAVADAEIAGLVWDSGRVLLEMGLPWLARTRSTQVDYTRLKCPALVIVGDRDRITPAGIARSTARQLIGPVDYHELPGVGHWLWWRSVGERIAGLAEPWLAAMPDAVGSTSPTTA